MHRVDIRSAQIDDLPQIFAIYDHEVRFGTATFDTDVYSEAARGAWFEKHRNPKYPVLVACVGENIVGWASLSAWSDRRAYDRMAEESVYVHPEQRGQGIGRALLVAIIDKARAARIAVLLARITSESAASRHLHEQLGFRLFGTMRRVGEKFGRILDGDLLDLHLDGG